MNILSSHKISAILCLLISATFLLIAAPLCADDSEWDYTGSIYMWAPSMTMTTPEDQEGELPFYQILNDLQMTLMGDLTARKDRWSFGSDLIYMNLKQSDERDFIGPITGRQEQLKGTIRLKSWIVTPTVGYAIYDNEDARVEVIGGVRYLWMKVGLKITDNGTPIFNESGSEGFWDGIFGMRASVNVNENWYVPAYADYGAGNSAGTWQALSGVGYRWKNYQTSLTYRYLQYKFDDIPTLSKLVVKGPLLNFSFHF